jgi:hypothetical protein
MYEIESIFFNHAIYTMLFYWLKTVYDDDNDDDDDDDDDNNNLYK